MYVLDSLHYYLSTNIGTKIHWICLADRCQHSITPEQVSTLYTIILDIINPQWPSIQGKKHTQHHCLESLNCKKLNLHTTLKIFDLQWKYNKYGNLNFSEMEPLLWLNWTEQFYRTLNFFGAFKILNCFPISKSIFTKHMDREMFHLCRKVTIFDGK